MSNKALIAILLFALFLVSGAAGATKHALLIGVGAYDNPVSALLAPPFDVSGVEEALVEQWGFEPDKIVKVLDGDATRDGILAAFRNLEVVTEPDDFVFIYYAGHGTSALDVNVAAALPHTSGALIPTDFNKDGSAVEISQSLVVGRRDIRPILENLDRNGREVFFAVDACYSGNTVRGELAGKAGIPALKPRAAELISPASIAASGAQASAPEPYPYERVYYLSAAGEHEPAGEITEDLLPWYPTHDGKPHGAFTDALLRAMKGLNEDTDANGNGNVSYLELFNSVRNFMAKRGYQQTPQFLPTLEEASTNLADTIVFNTPGALDTLSAKAVDVAPLVIRLVGATSEDEAAIANLKQLEVVETGASDLVFVRDGDAAFLTNGAGDKIAAAQDKSAQNLWSRIRAELWAHYLVNQIAQPARASLTVQFAGDAMGGTAVRGENVGIVMSVDQPSYLVLLNINAYGGVSLLYPYFESEMTRTDPNKVVSIPDSVVVPPFGVDKLIALAFERPVTGLQNYLTQTLEPGQAELENFKQLLAGTAAASGVSMVELVTVESPDRGDVSAQTAMR